MTTIIPTAARPLPSIRILGLTIHNVTMETALATIDDFIRDGSPHQIVTADASMLVQANEDRELGRIVADADLITPDGAGVLWAARRAGTPLAERVSGVELVEKLCALSPERGYRLYFLGAAPGVAEQAADRMRARYPGVQIVGTQHGFIKPDEMDSVVEAIRDSRPDALFVAMGIPKQEKWIAAYRDRLGVPVLVGVGGTFDVLSGKTKRAPVWMQNARLEWLWRLLANPRKISKVKLLPRFVYMVRSAPKTETQPAK